MYDDELIDDPDERIGYALRANPTEAPGGSALRQWIAGPWGRAIIPGLTAAAGAFQRVPGRFGPARAGIPGLISGGLSGLDLVMGAEEKQGAWEARKRAKERLQQISRGLREPRSVTEPKSLEDLEQERGRAALDVGLEPGLELGEVLSRVSPTRTRALQPSRKELMTADLADTLAESRDISGAANLLSRHALREPKIVKGSGYPTYELDEFSGERKEIAPATVSATTQAEISAKKEIEADEERRRRRAEQIAGLPNLTRERKRASIAALGLDPGKFLAGPRKLKIEKSTDEKGNQSVLAIDEESGQEVWRKALGRHPVTIERTTKNFRERLSLRAQGKDTGDAAVDGLTAEQAAKALDNLRGRQDQPRRGSTNEAVRAMQQVTEAPGYEVADERGKRQMLEETANRFGLSIVGDVPLKRGKFGFGAYDLGGLALAPMESSPATAARAADAERRLHEKYLK